MGTFYSRGETILCQTCWTEKSVRSFPKNPRTHQPDSSECRSCLRKREADERPQFSMDLPAALRFPAQDSDPPTLTAALEPQDSPATRPGPVGLFYRDDQWRFVPAPYGSEALSSIVEQHTLLQDLLAQSVPTTIPVEFEGTPHARPCREWRGQMFEDGRYGKIWITPRHFASPIAIGTHRARLFVRDGCLPPSEILTRHLCHNKACLEVAHLAWGTNEENQRDTALKNARQILATVRVGEFPAELALEIRIAVLIYGYSHEGVARLTGLHPEEIAALLEQEITVV